MTQIELMFGFFGLQFFSQSNGFDRLTTGFYRQKAPLTFHSGHKLGSGQQKAYPAAWCFRRIRKAALAKHLKYSGLTGGPTKCVHLA